MVITGREASTLKKAETQLARHGIRVLPVVCDIRDERAVAALMAAVKRQFRGLDILLNNAGVAHENLPVDKLPVAAWREVIDTNLTGMFLVTRAALPLMKRGTTIVNNLSISAKRPFPGMSAYTAAKHGGLGFTKTLREEVRPRGIRVIALLPGAVDTAIWGSFWSEAPREKMMAAETVARAVVDALCLPDNSTVEELMIMPTAGAL